jgi:hypothetical protein
MEVSEVCGRLVPASVRPLARRQLVRYRYLGLRAADALLVSYPASGSTWLRFLLAHALTGDEADFDSVRSKVPPVGRHRSAPAILPGGGRLVRTHEPLGAHAGRRGQPVVYLVRDGRTVALSYYEHLRREGRFRGELPEFLERFVEGALDGYGPWPEHVTSALEFGQTNPGSFLLLRYEQLRAEPETTLGRALTFLGRDRDRDFLARVVAANTKDRMRAKEGDSRFLAGRRTDGTPVVRPERNQSWADLVSAEARARFEAACGAALTAAGYAG